MPKVRLPKELWDIRRRKVLERDNYQCVRCKTTLKTNTAHIDHIQSGKLANNQLSNLRALCRRCHVLRADPRHRGMIAGALRDGIIPVRYESLLWEG